MLFHLFNSEGTYLSPDVYSDIPRRLAFQRVVEALTRGAFMVGVFFDARVWDFGQLGRHHRGSS
ncbi:hypothetical protein HS088_TW11G01062 [Tripterygium wilfordii]|uniref:Uncharacterized protein n=1 Tax=Tripterygium wilfordii TaxID=458696 RepID=A0A7J7D3R7_TRIWF|nr:hypothetical protein HS088_TW11G01062 [Tripterygium wilfordii]